jgi:uncharacterized protein
MNKAERNVATKLGSLVWPILFLLFLNMADAAAASFACTKAKGVEKKICDNFVLSQWDDQLSIAYRISLKSELGRAASISDQRKWIVETRDRCADERCLLRVYKERVSWLESEIKAKGVRCDIDESKLIGDWERLKDGFFEEFSIISADGERLFSSWLHHSPEFIGTWDFKNCVLHLKNDSHKELDEDYAVLGIHGNVLYLKSASRNESSLYRRVKT